MASFITDITFNKYLKRWLEEDVPAFDIASCLLKQQIRSATIFIKSPGVICGIPFVTKIFKKLNCDIVWHVEEGDYITERKSIAIVTGTNSDLLTGERIALNLLSECSGIATNCRKHLELSKTVETFTGVLAATRKITLGFSLFQKYAVIIGGCDTHRINISSMVMIKDNHRDISKNEGIAFSEYFAQVKKVAGFSQKIEIECRNIEEVDEAIQLGADIIMLDNFKPNDVNEVSRYIKEKNSSILVDVSGGINIDNLIEYLGPNIDIISMSTLIRGVKHVDYSMKINKVQDCYFIV